LVGDVQIERWDFAKTWVDLCNALLSRVKLVLEVAYKIEG
jgi:hypothetical protein